MFSWRFGSKPAAASSTTTNSSGSSANNTSDSIPDNSSTSTSSSSSSHSSFISSIPTPTPGNQANLVLHRSVFTNDINALRTALSDSSLDVNSRDSYGNTPLILAAILGRKEHIQLLLEKGALTKVRNAAGYSALAESISYGDREIIQKLWLNYRSQAKDDAKGVIPALLKKLNELADFNMEIDWKFSSWVPFLSRLLPHDTLKISKSGCHLRMDTTLVDFKGMQWQRGNLSFLFRGDGKKGDIDVFAIHHDKKMYQSLTEDAEEMTGVDVQSSAAAASKEDNKSHKPLPVAPTSPAELELLETDIDSFQSSPISAARLTGNTQFSPVYSGWIYRTHKIATISGYSSLVYQMKGFEVSTFQRTEHLTEEDLAKLNEMNAIINKRKKELKKQTKDENENADEDDEEEEQEEEENEGGEERQRSEEEIQAMEEKFKKMMKDDKHEEEAAEKPEGEDAGQDKDKDKKKEKEGEVDNDAAKDAGEKHDDKDKTTEDKKKEKENADSKEEKKHKEPKKVVHRQSVPPPPASAMTAEEYFSKENQIITSYNQTSFSYPRTPILPECQIGRPHKVSKSLKKQSATVHMSKEYPLQIDMISQLLDLIAPYQQHICRLRDFIHTRLPPGFPVQIELPLVPTIKATVTFGKFRLRNESEQWELKDEDFEVPKEYKRQEVVHETEDDQMMS